MIKLIKLYFDFHIAFIVLGIKHDQKFTQQYSIYSKLKLCHKQMLCAPYNNHNKMSKN